VAQSIANWNIDTEVPSEETILAVGRSVIDSIDSWKQGKSFHHNTVRTYSRPKGPADGAAWFSRVSEHDANDASLDEFWSKLGADKAENEMNFIHEIKKVALVKRISPSQSVWTLYYTFSPPISPRVFTVLQTTHFDEETRTGHIVSLPIDLSDEPELAKLEEHGARGRYTSVERLKELPDSKVEWKMATSSTPGGSIPQFIVDRTMAGKISDDVPHFLKWLKSTRDTAGKDSAAAPATTENGGATAA